MRAIKVFAVTLRAAAGVRIIAGMRSIRNFSLILVIAALAFALACTRSYEIARRPFVHAEIPEDFPKLPLRVALVKTSALDRVPAGVGEKYGLDKQLGLAIANGLFDAARLAVEQVEWVEEPTGKEFDLICVPQNPYFEFRKHRENRFLVQFTMEVIVREVDTGRERGLLLQSEGVPGRRPAVPVAYRSLATGAQQKAGVTGALTHGTRFEQAINNALFYLSLDFAEKLRKRGESILRAR
ncbi:MAG: hypothetical protein P9L99_20075 [Candidatus Lernaella stagnicola]|nr:hypothetical protein [Candidatus Lernaella stagnicola]